MAPAIPSPQVIGVCAHCGQELYEGQPVARPTFAAPALSHVACAVFALRDY